MIWRTVPIDLVADIWPAVTPLLQPAIDHLPVITLEDVLARIHAQHADLMVLVDDDRVTAALVIELYRHPSGNLANVWLMGGDRGFLKHHDEMNDAVEAWSRARGCAKIMFTGRPGWGRFKASRGWQTAPALYAWRFF